MDLYPLKFEPIYKPKVWGGRKLECPGRTLPPGELIGESWELADLGSTSPGGGGGNAERSSISNGALAGQTLHDLIQRFGSTLLGDLPLNDRGEFPLLLKYLDARENVSVQVHPSPAYARAHPKAHLKSEAWYIVDAEPGAVIYKGLKEGVTTDDLRAAAARGGVEPLLHRVPAKPGDCHYLPSGTCHALGAGIMVAEVQTASDTTFRLYDWGRKGRELHVEESLACIDSAGVEAPKPRPSLTGDRHGVNIKRLVHCEHFCISKFTVAEGLILPIPSNRQPTIWMVLEGHGVVSHDGEEVDIQRGETLLLPTSHDPWDARFKVDTAWLQVSPS